LNSRLDSRRDQVVQVKKCMELCSLHNRPDSSRSLRSANCWTAVWQVHRLESCSPHIDEFDNDGFQMDECQMDELTARLESLLVRYAAARDRDDREDSQLWEQFRSELHLLTAEYGPKAVDAALDNLPDGAGRPTALH